MRNASSIALAILAMVLTLFVAPGSDAYHSQPPDGGDHQHGEPGGHLPPSSHNVQLVGKVKLTNVAGGIADVSAFGNYAYIAEGGNDFWGTFPHILGTDPNSEAAKAATQRPYLLMSDRDSGLWIFRYTGPEP